MAFDQNKYKAIFESRYGKGSFEAGLQQARNIGYSKVQADTAKKDYLAGLKIKKKKTYDDALNYWNENSEHLRSRGVHNIENDYLNDPRAKATIKEQGFTQNDFIDAMYSVASGGAARSKREKKQQDKKEKDTVSQEKLPLISMEKTPYEQWKESKNKGKSVVVAKDKVVDDILSDLEVKQKNIGTNNTKKQKKKDEPFLTDVKNFFTGKDTDGDGDRDGLLGAIDRFVLPISKGATEFIAPGNNQRMIQNDIQKDGKLNNPVNKASIVDRGMETKVLNTAGTLLAALSPYGQSYKAVDWGFNKLPKLANTITNPYVQKTIKGGIAGGMAEAGISGVNELVNSEAYNKDDYLKRIGMGAAGGAILDPALYGAGQALRKGAESTMRNLLPQNEQVANTFADALKSEIPAPLPPQALMPKLKMSSAFEALSGYLPKVQEPTMNVSPSVNNIVPALPIKVPKATEQITLKTVQPTKSIISMSKEELQSLRQNLVQKQRTLPKGQRHLAQTIQEDIEQVDSMLLKLDLQLFGKTEAEIAQNAIRNSEAPPAVNVVDELQNIKDIKQIQVGTKNLYEIADRLPPTMGENIKRSLDASKVKYTKQIEVETNALYNKVVKELGIKKGSKESALVQDFGEKTLAKKFLESKGIDPNIIPPREMDMLNLERLKIEAPKNWEKIVQADQFFRSQYDRLIDEVNTVRSKIYPNNPEKQVPNRSDYYHHFNVLEGFEGIKNLFDSPANISPQLEGVSPFTRPSAKFQGFMQKRGLGPYKSDAVGGFLKYVKAASHSINVDPVIPVVRNTAKEIANATENTKNANKIIEALVDHANDLAGKTNPYDRVAQKTIGRKGMQLITALNSRVKSNMILGNFGSMVAQTGSIPLGIAKAKQYALPGLKNTMQQTAKELLNGDKSAPIYKSVFLKERFQDVNFARFDQRWIDQPKKLAVWAMGTVDKVSSRSIWNSMYAKAVKEKIADPIKYADYETRKIIAGRGVGEVPLLQKSNVTQVLAPFTLEVGNQWKVLGEMFGKKDAAAIITYLVAAYSLNQAYTEIRGSNVTYDPIDAILDGYNKGEGGVINKSLNATGSLAGETIGNIPGGNLLLNALPEDKKVPGTDIRFEELWGDRNPNRFGEGIAVGKAAPYPLYALLPFGANQVHKTAQGVKALMNDGVYKGDNGANPFGGPKEELMYPVKPNLWDQLKLPVMGPSSTSSAREYYDNERRPLTADQTKAYELLKKKDLGDEFYEVLRVKDTKPYVKSKFTRIMKDKDLSNAEKQAALEELLGQVRGK